MKKLTLVKIGGNIIDDENALNDFLTLFQLLPGKKVLVHGGGKIATELSKKMGLDPEMVKGRRVTDAEMLKVVTMVYAGLTNKTVGLTSFKLFDICFNPSQNAIVAPI